MKGARRGPTTFCSCCGKHIGCKGNLVDRYPVAWDNGIPYAWSTKYLCPECQRGVCEASHRKRIKCGGFIGPIQQTCR